MGLSTAVLMSAVCAAALAQTAGRERAAEPPPPALEMVVLQGQGAIHNVASGETTEAVVEVRDESGKPVGGAEVTFELPAKGPGGVFSGGRNVLEVKSNPQGQAAGLGFTPNRVEGEYLIAVTARLGPRKGRTVIRQGNSLRTSSPGVRKRERSGAWKIVLAVGGAAAAGGIFALTRGGGSSSASTAVPPNLLTVTAGPITVAPPR